MGGQGFSPGAPVNDLRPRVFRQEGRGTEVDLVGPNTAFSALLFVFFGRGLLGLCAAR
jgi:hypothetical protein